MKEHIIQLTDRHNYSCTEYKYIFNKIKYIHYIIIAFIIIAYYDTILV